ncbi:hypothetical protein BDV27DRAFT_35725 [Aspergillus caelatus]|uniref:Uncharacterized protein n=1 Tax=Aspergillus caelatus TaxID=61420 RepID=A0A5N7AL59_9EURO|nr:uncharacterized protein BDV27DRAFT_35725 [Aspergillus caelatus]KAE8370654.1 hypothetical protein BDV27DRAFT_35725 [Aspergillus caelatus]
MRDNARKSLARARSSARTIGSKVLTPTRRLLGMTYRSGWFFVLQYSLTPYAIVCKAYMVFSLLFVSVGNRRLACPGCREVTSVDFPHYPQRPSTAALTLFPISILNSNIAGNNV